MIVLNSYEHLAAKSRRAACYLLNPSPLSIAYENVQLIQLSLQALKKYNRAKELMISNTDPSGCIAFIDNIFQKLPLCFR